MANSKETRELLERRIRETKERIATALEEVRNAIAGRDVFHKLKEGEAAQEPIFSALGDPYAEPFHDAVKKKTKAEAELRDHLRKYRALTGLDYKEAPMRTGPDIHELLLGNQGMAEGHKALVHRFKWFVHETSVWNLGGVRERGLVPRKVARSLDTAEERILDGVSDEIVCLHPLGSQLTPRSSQSGPFVLLSVRAAHLPARVGVDWSYTGCWERARRIWNGRQGDDAVGEVLVGVADVFGSIISYERLPPDTLRVCCDRELRGEPESWPLLVEADENKILRVDE